jgi:hypothetical protein
VAKLDELQRLLRLAVKSIGWSPEGTHKVQFYTFSSGKNKNEPILFKTPEGR